MPDFFLGSRPSTRFSANDSEGTSMKCWWTMPMPAAMASREEPNLTGLPFSSRLPELGASSP